MLRARYTTKFKKDLARSIKRGKNIKKLTKLVDLLISETKLPQKYKDHPLSGNYLNRRDCHIEPDWILIYKKDANTIIFERTGTHADLF